MLSLRTLNVSSNPFLRIDPPPPEAHDSPRLPRLESIIMHETHVTDWQSIDHLQTMFGRTLGAFKYSICEESRTAPVEEKVGKMFTGTMDDRVYLVAKLPALETLNGTSVSFICRSLRDPRTEGPWRRSRNKSGQTPSGFTSLKLQRK